MRSVWCLVQLVCGLNVKPFFAHGASVSPTQLGTTLTPPTLEHLVPTKPPRTNETGGLSCVFLLPPRRGSYYVEQGTGVSVGSILVFWCRDGYQLVGNEKIMCVLLADSPKWSSYMPICESLPKPNDQGLHMALLLSVLSGMVILVMSISFIICCIQEDLSKKKKDPRTSRSRKRGKWHSRSGRSSAWLVREELDWEAFSPPKIFNLSQPCDQTASSGIPLQPALI